MRRNSDCRSHLLSQVINTGPTSCSPEAQTGIESHILVHLLMRSLMSAYTEITGSDIRRPELSIEDTPTSRCCDWRFTQRKCRYVLSDARIETGIRCEPSNWRR